MRQTLRIALALALTSAALSAAPVKFTPHEYASGSRKVDAELGELAVPENRSKPGSRTITLRFVRFKATSTNPRHPIVYLTSGSGIESLRGTRYPLAMALREFGDVIAFDQRGVNRSDPDMRCTEEYTIPPGEPLDRAKSGAQAADATRKCAERLRAAGVDLAGYNTRESAADLEDLRKALGADRLVLWGISSGTHLAVAMLRDYPQSVDRVILAGIKGPDDTYKLPSDQQQLLEYLAWLAAEDGKSPDLIASIRNVLRELDARPKTVSMTHPVNGRTGTFVFGKFDLQVALADMLFGPDTFAGLPDLVARLERGDWTALALLAAPRRYGSPGSLTPIAMDCASGISLGRKQRIAEEAKRTLLGDAINAPFPEVCSAIGVPDLGDEFRGPLASDVRALLISGSLDGRTPPHQADELRMTMPNAHHVVVAGGGHGDPLYLASPKILLAMKAFMNNEPLRERYIGVAAVPFLPVRKVITVRDEILSRYVGTYRIDDKSVRRVVKAGSLLYTIRDNTPPFAVRPLSETEFFYETTPSTITFEVDAMGTVVAMVLRTPDGKSQRSVKE